MDLWLIAGCQRKPQDPGISRDPIKIWSAFAESCIVLTHHWTRNLTSSSTRAAGMLEDLLAFSNKRSGERLIIPASIPVLCLLPCGKRHAESSNNHWDTAHLSIDDLSLEPSSNAVEGLGALSLILVGASCNGPVHDKSLEAWRFSMEVNKQKMLLFWQHCSQWGYQMLQTR